MKRIISGALCLLLLGGAAMPARAEETAEIETTAKAVLLMERETGRVLYEENAHEALEPASVTKIMTMLLTAEAIDGGSLRESDQVTVSAAAAGMGGSQVYLEEGEQMTVGDLLKAVAVASGNDAAVALAEHQSGSEAAFVERMNRRAQELGMKDTHFCNCTGLPAEGHCTSVYDIALMSRELLRHSLIRKYTGIWMDTLRGGSFQLANTNKLIYYYKGATGLKTGSTDGAGYCISATAQREGMELIAVVLGAESSKDRFETAKALLNYGFGGWGIGEALPEEPLAPVPVELGKAETVQPVAAEPTRLLVQREQLGKITTEFQLVSGVPAPVEPGQKLGEMKIFVDGTPAGTVELVAAEGVERLGFGEIFREMLGQMSPVG